MAKEWFSSGRTNSVSVSVTDVWKVFGDGQVHNSFPDICFFRGRYYLGFSNHRIHAGDTASKGVILVSEDCRVWYVSNVLYTGRETEEPKFMVFNDQLFVYFFESYFPDDTPVELKRLHPRDWTPEMRRRIVVAGWCASTTDGDTWSAPVRIQTGWKHWRPAAWNGTAYCVAHPKHEGTPCKLEKSSDGITWQTVCTIPIPGEEKPNEASLAFDESGTMYVFIRRDSTRSDCHSYLLVAREPYTDWEKHDLGQRLGGPLCVYVRGELLLGARFFTAGGSPHAGLFRVTEDWQAELLHVFPSEGDSSYLGMTEDHLTDGGGDSRFLVTYYSSHESLGGDFWNNKPSIYLARVRVAHHR